MKSTFVLAILILSATAFAQTEKTGDGPCAPIAKACRDAGYVNGGWKSKNGVWANCVHPLVKGNKKTVTSPSGKSVNAADFTSSMSACAAKLEEMKEKHQEKKRQ